MSGRRFNGRQRAALYLAQNGCCAWCGVQLRPGWHADHMVAWIHGGATDTINGQALCANCNLKKGSKDARMDVMSNKGEWPQSGRDWQFEAWEKYVRDQKQDWLLCATPGAGKTKWALYLARYMLDHGTIGRVVVVAPTRSVRDQWAVPDQKQRAIVNLDVVQNEHGGIENPKDFEGCVVTYAQVASNPDLQRRGCRKKTLVIFDEIHHAGFPNISWGEKAKNAFELASYRVALTGTPWRRPGSGRIPFVTYDEEQRRVHVDYQYEYGQAAADGVCRYIEFRAFNGEVEYVNLDSCIHSTIIYNLEDEDDTTSVLRDLLKPDGIWIHSMFEKAHQELLHIRSGEDGEGAIPDAKGLVIADDQYSARTISKYIETFTKERPELIISDEADSEQALNRFKTNKTKWAVAVNKVSEGVDVPPLYVGVYATRKKTPLTFRQIVGRFVRRRVGTDNKPRLEEDRAAVLFMPAVPALKELAEQIQEELRHTLDEEIEECEKELAEQNKSQSQELTGEENAIPIEISQAELNAVIIGGLNFTQTEYIQAQEVADKYGFRADQVTKLAYMLRDYPNPASPPVTVSPIIQPQGEVEETVPAVTLKKILLAEVNRLSNKKAIELGIDFKDFGAHIIKRYGCRRHEMSINQLKDARSWLDNLHGIEGL